MLVNKKIIGVSVLLVSGFLIQASQFWLQPVNFIVKTGESVVVNFKEGENFMGRPGSLKKDDLLKLELHHKNTMKDLKGEIVEGEKGAVTATLANEGTYVLVMQSGNAFSNLEAEKFNTYLKEDELDDAYTQREKTNGLNKNGTELYAYCAKLLVQAGEKPDNTFRKETGLPVEIIPEQNPYGLKVGSPIQFKILYMGKPLFGAKVRVWNNYKNRVTVQNIYSQQDGMISTYISNPGMWMVSFIKMIPSKDPKADWQSYKASLVFGIR